MGTMTNIPTIMDDKRTIEHIGCVFPNGGWYEVGTFGVTKIEPYEEHGWGSMVTWFAVYVGDEIACRVPAHSMNVSYVLDGAE